MREYKELTVNGYSMSNIERMIKANQKLNLRIKDLLLENTYLKKDITRLNKENNKVSETLIKYDNEVIRLNNIIDELEKWLEEQWLEWKDCETDVRFMANEDKAILNKLKELKGGKE